MGSANIQAKIRNGLAKAVNKTGSSNSELVYLVTKSDAGTPLNPLPQTETQTLLVNAIFKSYSKFLTDVSIKAGDRELVSDSDVEIKANDIIRQGSSEYIVVSVSLSAPTSDVLNYISQVRLK